MQSIRPVGEVCASPTQASIFELHRDSVHHAQVQKDRTETLATIGQASGDEEVTHGRHPPVPLLVEVE